ncbi:Hypothetical predicted protein [Pelobates cultripes]|uniref:Selenoprotein O n=1 Tax=Pelobates cultripes TaxID=61616 RepID=A0AAD1RVU3_PELCU|nr:Hypothetical predicted protein [Pelobates cultripes]
MEQSLSKLKPVIMLLNRVPPSLSLLAAIYSCCLGWKSGPPFVADKYGRFILHKSNTSGFCERKTKVPSMDLWSVPSDDVLADLPVDPIRTNYVRKVKNCIFSLVYPTPFMTNTHLVAVSGDVLDVLDLDISVVNEEGFLHFVSGGKTDPVFIPLAHRYGGHQFSVWAGQLGDGRAHLVGAYINRYGERWELQLKGSGKTPYSRNGDGRAVLRSSIREFLCSEAMHFLGIPTSRAASIVVSDDAIWRDQFYNGNFRKERGAVVLRVAKSWFRIGSLEILTHSGEYDLLRILVEFIIKEHFPSISIADPSRVLEFFSRVVHQTANLIALWMSVGFTHGVCNTDNFSLLSITIDYGPFGFMEDYDADYVPNTSDDEGRYRIGNQANVGMFNMNKLLQALNPLMDSRQKQLFKELFSVKFGFLGETEQDFAIIALFLSLLEDTRADFTMTFRDLSEITEEQLLHLSIPQEYWALHIVSQHKNFPKWVHLYLQRLKRNTDDTDSKRRERMSNSNPRYVLRNWMAESAVLKAERNDFSEVRLLLNTLRQPFRKQKIAEMAGYSKHAPAWARDLKVSCSS